MPHEVGTEKVWEMVEELGLPRIIVINKLDRENSSFKRTLEPIQQFFGRKAVPVELPVGDEKNFRGVVDLIRKKAYIFEKDESGKFKKETDEKLGGLFFLQGKEQIPAGPARRRISPPNPSRVLFPARAYQYQLHLFQLGPRYPD